MAHIHTYGDASLTLYLAVTGEMAQSGPPVDPAAGALPLGPGPPPPDGAGGAMGALGGGAPPPVPVAGVLAPAVGAFPAGLVASGIPVGLVGPQGVGAIPPGGAGGPPGAPGGGAVPAGGPPGAPGGGAGPAGPPGGAGAAVGPPGAGPPPGPAGAGAALGWPIFLAHGLPAGIEKYVCSITAMYVDEQGNTQIIQSNGITCSLRDALGDMPVILLPSHVLRVKTARLAPGEEIFPEYPIRGLIIGGGSRAGGIQKTWHLMAPGGHPLQEGHHFTVHPRQRVHEAHRKETDVAVVKVQLDWLSNGAAAAAAAAAPGAAPGAGARQPLGGPAGFFAFDVINPTVVRGINVPRVGAAPGSFTLAAFPPAVFPPAPVAPVGQLQPRVNRLPQWNGLAGEAAGSVLMARSLTSITLPALQNWEAVPETEKQYAPEAWVHKAVGPFRRMTASLPGEGMKRAFKDRATVAVGHDVLLADSTRVAHPSAEWGGCPWLDTHQGTILGMDLGRFDPARPNLHYAASLAGAPLQALIPRVRRISGITQGNLQAR